MDQFSTAQKCPVCGGANLGGLSICAACEEAFKSADTDFANRKEIDLTRYNFTMFPWEQADVVPRLLSGRWSYLTLSFGLILIVVLLALLRTPLPTCWEISS